MEVEADRRTGRDGTGRPAGLTAGQGSGAACHCQDDVSASACACPAPGFLKWYPGFLSSLVFFFHFGLLLQYVQYLLTSWSRIEIIIAQSHTTKLSRKKKKEVYNMKLGGESNVMTVLGLPRLKAASNSVSVFFSASKRTFQEAKMF